MKQSRSSLKVMTIVGTRPEIIRLSRTMALLDRSLDHVLVHTGQNYDYELNEIFFRDLELRKPDHFLKVNTRTLGSMLGDTLAKSEQVILGERPDAVLILGDTNSSIAGIMAKRHRIPVYHMEAGNRCFDFNVPEEINRRIIDHIADFNLVYTEHARRHLLSEGLPHRRIYLTGSPMYEVLSYYGEKIASSPVLNRLGLKRSGYFLVSTHREENVDFASSLKLIVETINRIAAAYGKPVVVSTHPRTRRRLREHGIAPFRKNVKLLKPFGFLDYVWLQQNALCTISDSGTISEESAILSFPAVTIRNSFERPEAADSGTIVLTGTDPRTVLDSIEATMRENREGVRKHLPPEYAVSDTSWRVLKLILGTAKLSNKWMGIIKE